MKDEQGNTERTITLNTESGTAGECRVACGADAVCDGLDSSKESDKIYETIVDPLGSEINIGHRECNPLCETDLYCYGAGGTEYKVNFTSGCNEDEFKCEDLSFTVEDGINQVEINANAYFINSTIIYDDCTFSLIEV